MRQIVSFVLIICFKICQAQQDVNSVQVALLLNKDQQYVLALALIGHISSRMDFVHANLVMNITTPRLIDCQSMMVLKTVSLLSMVFAQQALHAHPLVHAHL